MNIKRNCAKAVLNNFSEEFVRTFLERGKRDKKVISLEGGYLSVEIKNIWCTEVEFRVSCQTHKEFCFWVEFPENGKPYIQEKFGVLGGMPFKIIEKYKATWYNEKGKFYF